jgi:hypothetical protein
VQDYLALVRMANLQTDVQDLGPAAQAWATELQALVVARGVTMHQYPDVAWPLSKRQADHGSLPGNH